jgi:hypothetical protein
LCLSCFKLRLDRDLGAGDFLDCMANKVNKEVALLLEKEKSEI